MPSKAIQAPTDGSESLTNQQSTAPQSGAVIKRSVSINGHRTSYSVEQAFQLALQNIAAERNISLAKLIAMIDAERPADASLSSAIRVYILQDALSYKMSDHG